MSGSARLGVLGGTFDPIHNGHLDAALAARAHLRLDRVLLLPSKVPPHRPAQPRASAYHRFAMAALAAQEHEGLEASDLELRQQGLSYTARTLAALREGGVTPRQIFFIIGADAFAEISTWYDYPAILDAAHFVVVSRPGHRHEAALERAAAVSARVVDLRGEARPADVPPGTAVFFLTAPTRDVSSTGVRQRLEAGEDVSDVVPAGVARHIQRHHLYQPAVTAAHLHG